jgi:TolB-like protein/DNA-binding winged helix-turn-helix (wHTH) protein/Flp pilus assembly protein TadD
VDTIRSHEAFRFGVFELDPATLELRRSGQRVALRPQAAKLLVLLVRHAGELVSRETIRHEVWDDDTVVEFDQGVNTCIRQIRAALGDDARHSRFVETVPKRGYRFLADVQRIESLVRAPKRSTTRAVGARVATVGVAIVALVAVVLSRPWQRPSVHERTDGRTRLAVLPFENLSGDSTREYFSDGLTEELIFQLSRMRPDKLAVIARTSVIGFKGTSSSIAEIGAALDVDFVLEGSVRHESERVRVTAQLIQVRDEVHVWAETYERNLDNVFALQGDVAVRVTDALAIELLVPDAAPRHGAYTTSAQAYDLYLQARHQWNRFDRDGMRHAEALLRQALSTDSTFALAWAALADVYNLMPYYTDLGVDEAYPQAAAFARRALEIDSQLAAAYNALGFALFYYDRDWSAANAAFSRAVELEPGYAMAHHWYSGLLSALGRNDEAIRHNRLAVELDPLSLSVRSDLAWYYLFARRYEEAAAEARRALAQEPYHGWSRSGLILALTRLDQYPQALAQVRIRLEQNDEPTTALDALHELPASEALRRFRMQSVEKAKLEGWTPEKNAYGYAVEHAMIADIDTALDALEMARDRHDAWIVFAAVDPRLDALRDHPRFAALLDSLNLGAEPPPSDETSS